MPMPHALAGHEPWTLHNKVSDSAKTKAASGFTSIDYPKPDNKITFELLTNLQVPPRLSIAPRCTE